MHYLFVFHLCLLCPTLISPSHNHRVDESKGLWYSPPLSGQSFVIRIGCLSDCSRFKFISHSMALYSLSYAPFTEALEFKRCPCLNVQFISFIEQISLFLKFYKDFLSYSIYSCFSQNHSFLSVKLSFFSACLLVIFLLHN